MVIVSAKVSKRKILLTLAAAAAVILLLVFLLDRSEQPPGDADAPTQSMKASTNEERIQYLTSLGWEVQQTPVETQEVRIPEEFNDVFTRYNQLQQTQGFDLSEYAGKSVKRYVYAITNYPDGSADYEATVLVCQNRIIGGDVSSRVRGGRMHGLQMPADAETPTA